MTDDQLSDARHDALTELINIAYGRAAAALSELTGRRVAPEVPRVSVAPVDRVLPLPANATSYEVTIVNQVFSGTIAGNALLVLDVEAALLLAGLLENGGAARDQIDTEVREIITEAGNILLNACLGVFGNLLKVEVSFAVPRLHVDSFQQVLKSILVGTSKLDQALVVRTRFQLPEGSVAGHFMIILGLASLGRLMVELEEWAERS